ncbi:MAG: hypothetical protein EB150_08865 [Nitrososphaeria archaeon]|jgi:hypothetical protein|nr:hypothetical protein [Nitrososphaeria archaeon]
MAQSAGNAKNILVGASPLFISNIDITEGSAYKENAEPGSTDAAAYETSKSYVETLNGVTSGAFYYRNVGFTNNGLQITYNPTYDSVTVDQLLDTAKLFKSAMEVMIATEMSEGTLENVLVVFGQGSDTLTSPSSGTQNGNDVLALAGGALGEAPTERQLIAVGQAPTTASPNTERVYYARRVLSVQQSQFSLARTTPTTFPVTFRLLPDASKVGQEYGLIIDRAWA